MIKRKSPLKTRPQTQKLKLSRLLDCFEDNPYSAFKITTYRGMLHTVIDGDENTFL
jgi:hypothetical protein